MKTEYWLISVFCALVLGFTLTTLSITRRSMWSDARDIARQRWFAANSCQRSHYIGGSSTRLVYRCNGQEYVWWDMPHPGVKDYDRITFWQAIRGDWFEPVR